MEPGSPSGVELQNPAEKRKVISFANITKLKMRSSEIALGARVDAALKENSPSNYKTTNSSTTPPNSSSSIRYFNSRVARSLVALADASHMIIFPLLLISFLVVIVILMKGREVLVPFVIAIFFTYLLRPIVNFLTTPYAKCYSKYLYRCDPRSSSKNRYSHQTNEDGDEEVGLLSMHKRHSPRNLSSPTSFENNNNNKYSTKEIDEPMCVNQLPRPMAVFLVMLLAMSILGGGVLVVTDAVQGFERRDLILYQEEGSLLLNQTLLWVKHSFDVDGTYLLEKVNEQVGVISIFRAIIMFCVEATINIFWVLLFVLYLLYEQNHEDIHSKSSKTSKLRNEIDNQIQRYLGLKTIISVSVGVAVWLLLGPILRVRMAHLFALFTFILNFIPNAGPLVATFLPLPVVILDPSLMPVSKVFAIAGPVFIHGVVGNFIEPHIFGASLELHPVTVLLALAFWYLVWGSAGAILSVPITASIRIVLLQNQSGRYSRACLLVLDGRLFEAFEGRSEVEQEEAGEGEVVEQLLEKSSQNDWKEGEKLQDDGRE
jgi:predicted PurR-regulated permease PerM